MHAAAKTDSLVAPVAREYRFNKFGSVGKAAGIFLVITGYLIHSVLSDFEGERTLANVVRATPTLTVLIYAAVVLGLLGVLVMAMVKPASQLRIEKDEVIFTAGGRQIRLAIGSILAVASFERKGRGIVGRRKPRRSIAILANDGTNLVPIPTGVRWQSVDPDWQQQLHNEHPYLGAIVVPLHGMPAKTEDELRESLPGWI